MFPRGPRFPSTKVSDIPGPNTYNLNQDSQLDSYKRGAFLEKADRFSEEKPSEVPGPGTYDTNPMIATKPTTKQSIADANARIAALQRKLEDLDKIHADGKKSHTTELDRLKSELSRVHKTNTEQTERIDKLKKQNDGLEARLQESRKTSHDDQSEIKELRVKLRMSEHERGQLVSKQGETGEMKKALSAAEAKRKEDLRERDKKIAELERSLAGEKKRREGVELRLQDIKGKATGEVEEVRGTVKGLQSQVDDAVKEAQTAKARTGQAEQREERLINELDQVRSVLQRVAGEYGRLATSTVSIQSNNHLKRECASLKLRSFRLERKLANSEAQVTELAHLIRGTKDQHALLSHMLSEARNDTEWYAEALRQTALDSAIPLRSDSSLDARVTEIEVGFLLKQNQILETELETHRLFSQWNAAYGREVLRHFISVTNETNALADQDQVNKAALAASDVLKQRLSSQLEATQKEHEATRLQAAEVSSHLEATKSREEALKRELDAREKQHRMKITNLEEKLKKEHGTAAHLASTIQQKKIAEETLRAEVETLTNEVAQADGYQEAYVTLVEEVGALVDRNALAEGEAAKLSKFNAEILGHNNPAQRIVYVDRIRRELAETKQQLLQTLRDRDAAYMNNDDLKQELDMYKSVSVPVDEKPRTIMTRVARAPLANQNHN